MSKSTMHNKYDTQLQYPPLEIDRSKPSVYCLGDCG